MKAWIAERAEFDSLSLKTDVKIPELLDEHSVRIRVLAVGLNPVDWKHMGWDLPFNKYPRVIGGDGAGIIEKIGTAVDGTKFVEGQTLVFFLGNFLSQSGGTFAEYYVHDSRLVTPVPQEYIDAHPDDYDRMVANLAATPCASYTAYQIVFTKLKLTLGYDTSTGTNKKRAKTFLVTAASGGCGSFVLQYLKLWKDSLTAKAQENIKIIATCSARNFDYVKSLGATEVIDYTKQDIGEAARELTDGRGVDAWVEVMPGDAVITAFKNLAFGGEVVSIAGNPTYDINQLLFNANSLHHTSLGFCYTFGSFESQLEVKEIGDQVFEWLQQGKIHFAPSEVVPFEGLKDALQKNMDGHVRGKLVVKIASQ